MSPKSSREKTPINLVVVESPAKARTLGRILGKDYVIKASKGHVRDLPENNLGVDVEKGFTPSYALLKNKSEVVAELKKIGKNASSIYLATDPDREGEAISWHLTEETGWRNGKTPLRRVVFHEITEQAVKEAFQHPRDIDMQLVDSQQARRILDRLVGYQLSPLLWTKVQRGLSAGRVQSVALRLIVEREVEVQGFVPREYWTIEALFQKAMSGDEKSQPFAATLHSLKGQKGRLNIPDEKMARLLEKELKPAQYNVSQVKRREVRQTPSPPFITSTLQQEAWRKLHFAPKKTMLIAQQLYEGLSLGNEGSMGLITYMRTDSTYIASSAQEEARNYIREHFDKEYLPGQPRNYKRKVKGAQEAHEAIRPTSIYRQPPHIRPNLTADQFKLYDLIWSRTLASQMSDAISDATSVDIEAQPPTTFPTPNGTEGNAYIFRATGSVLKFPGFRILYLEGRDDTEEEDGKAPLPPLSLQEGLQSLRIETIQHFTQPPPRYSEASLIKLLEENGIGRPSTYAPIISTLLDRNYVLREQGKLQPTALGSTVSNLLTSHFSDIMDVSFTARMEEDLDKVAQGKRQWKPMLKDFYGPFHASLEAAKKQMPKVKVEEPTDESCEKCERPMVIKTGRFGRFLACTGFPQCRNTRPLTPQNSGQGNSQDGAKAFTTEPTDEICEKCSHPMVIKAGRSGRFIACSNFPKCRNTRPLKIGVVCPQCGKDLVELKGKKRGRRFYGCSNYPDCKFTLNKRPLPHPCPQCSGLIVASGREEAQCTACEWKGHIPEKEPVAAQT